VVCRFKPPLPVGDMAGGIKAGDGTTSSVATTTSTTSCADAAPLMPTASFSVVPTTSGRRSSPIAAESDRPELPFSTRQSYPQEGGRGPRYILPSASCSTSPQAIDLAGLKEPYPHLLGGLAHFSGGLSALIGRVFRT
jgi:hypothetical protein